MNFLQRLPRQLAAIFNPKNVAISGGNITGTNVEFFVAGSTIPLIALSSGSVAANGAISGITALANAYPTGAYCYFPANTLATVLAAGWYYCTFSTTTVGIAFLNTYTSGVPTIPSSPTAVTDGKGAFTGVTGEIDGLRLTLPANSIGLRGNATLETFWTVTNNANVKTIVARAGGGVGSGTIWLTTTLNSVARGISKVLAFALGANNAQYIHPTSGGGSLAPSWTAVDLSVAQDVYVNFNKSTATDNLTLESAFVRAMYRAA